jgi:hypothetical protein
LATCKTCKKPFTPPEEVARWAMFCPSCSNAAVEAKAAEVRDELHQKRIARYLELCPPAYRATTKDALPIPELLDRCCSWSCGGTGMGLLLHGKTGLGKSRIAWLLAKRECLAGKSIDKLTAMSGVDYAGKFEYGGAAAGKWIKEKADCGLLILDDVFKSSMADGFQSALFQIVNARCERLKPMIITLNDTGASLVSRLSPDRGEPLLRRIKQNCVQIAFTKPKAK